MILASNILQGLRVRYPRLFFIKILKTLFMKQILQALLGGKITMKLLPSKMANKQT
ncbi:MAG: hypothetical protein ACI9OH_003648 [Oleispira sp.]|jgi:hypothetical protein